VDRASGAGGQGGGAVVGEGEIGGVGSGDLRRIEGDSGRAGVLDSDRLSGGGDQHGLAAEVEAGFGNGQCRIGGQIGDAANTKVAGVGKEQAVGSALGHAFGGVV